MDEASLKHLLDRQAISDVVIRYATGIDMLDWAAYRSCFTDPVEVDFTSFSGGEPRTIPADAWVAGVRSLQEGFQATQHISSNHVITFQGADEATCVSYMHAQHYLPNAYGDNTLTLGGHYTNRLDRGKDGWRIRKCQLTVTWTVGNMGIFEQARARVARGEGRKGTP